MSYREQLLMAAAMALHGYSRARQHSDWEWRGAHMMSFRG